MIRAFIALELPGELRAAIGEVQDQLRRSAAGGKVTWTKPENLHLTLQFLGDIQEERVAGIVATLSRVAGHHARFPVAVGGVGAFPDGRLPRVLWAGCADPAGRLGALAEAVRAAGWGGADREFAPHVTMGRIARPRPDAALTRALDSLKDTACGTWVVDAVHLVRSELRPQGSVYTKLSSLPLKGD